MTSTKPDSPITRPCPQCGAPALLTRDNRFRPFCSERCQHLDLAGWFGESYVVPGPSAGHVSDDEADDG